MNDSLKIVLSFSNLLLRVGTYKLLNFRRFNIAYGLIFRKPFSFSLQLRITQIIENIVSRQFEVASRISSNFLLSWTSANNSNLHITFSNFFPPLLASYFNTLPSNPSLFSDIPHQSTLRRNISFTFSLHWKREHNSQKSPAPLFAHKRSVYPFWVILLCMSMYYLCTNTLNNVPTLQNNKCSQNACSVCSQ